MVDIAFSPSPRPGKTRVLVANEPRAYREVTAEALRRLRPDVEFVLADPADLEAEVSRLLPDVVFCNRATPAVRSGVPVWLELYPDGEATSVLGRGERISKFGDIQLPDLVEIVDRMVRLKA
jgi:hypothetical protein